MLSHAALVNVLKTRYDHYASQVMAKEILAGAGLEPRDDYGKAEIEKLVETVKGLGDARNGNLIARLESYVSGGAPAPAAEAVPEAAPAPADEAPAAEPEQAAAEPAEEKADDGGEEKGEDKAEKKGKKKK